MRDLGSLGLADSHCALQASSPRMCITPLGEPGSTEPWAPGLYHVDVEVESDHSIKVGPMKTKDIHGSWKNGLVLEFRRPCQEEIPRTEVECASLPGSADQRRKLAAFLPIS